MKKAPEKKAPSPEKALPRDDLLFGPIAARVLRLGEWEDFKEALAAYEGILAFALECENAVAENCLLPECVDFRKGFCPDEADAPEDAAIFRAARDAFAKLSRMPYSCGFICAAYGIDLRPGRFAAGLVARPFDWPGWEWIQKGLTLANFDPVAELAALQKTVDTFRQVASADFVREYERGKLAGDDATLAFWERFADAVELSPELKAGLFAGFIVARGQIRRAYEERGLAKRARMGAFLERFADAVETGARMKKDRIGECMLARETIRLQGEALRGFCTARQVEEESARAAIVAREMRFPVELPPAVPGREAPAAPGREAPAVPGREAPAVPGREAPAVPPAAPAKRGGKAWNAIPLDWKKAARDFREDLNNTGERVPSDPERCWQWFREWRNALPTGNNKRRECAQKIKSKIDLHRAMEGLRKRKRPLPKT